MKASNNVPQQHLVTYGLPIIDDPFVARKHGPVPSLTYKVLRGMEGKAAIETDELRDFAKALSLHIADGHQIVTLSPGTVCDEEELSRSNIRILDKWIRRCRDIGAFQLSDMSHDSAWQAAMAQAERTGEDIRMPQYSIAEAGGATPQMLEVIRERQSTRM